MENRDHQNNSPSDKSQRDSFNFEESTSPFDEGRPDFRPQESTSKLRIWWGVAVAVLVIFLTWYIFKAETIVEKPIVPVASQEQIPRIPDPGPSGKEPGTKEFAPMGDSQAGISAPPANEIKYTPSRAEPKARPEVKAKPEARPVTRVEAKAETKPDAKIESTVEIKTKPEAKIESTAVGSPSGEAEVETKSIADTKPEVPAKTEAHAPVGATVEDDQPESEIQVMPATADQKAPAVTDSQAPPQASISTSRRTLGKPVEAVKISNLWVVNILSTPDAEEALRILDQLLALDLADTQTYFYKTSIDGRLYHRTRVGFFATQEEAVSLGQKLFVDLNLSAMPWVVRPTVKEVQRYKKVNGELKN